MTLKACPQCGYRYNAPENQTCGKCKGWLGGAAAAAAAAPAPRRSLIPQTIPEALCYLALPVGALFGWPLPFGAAFGLVAAGLMVKVVRLDMERFSKGLLLGIVAAGIFFTYLMFLLVFSFFYGLLEPVLQPIVGRAFKH
ncbi:MAG: hypothetical protein E6H92_06515 [Chloroflexi bacterium]|nr:MAG: hypothetical protein E6H92_06515 [Chloroflexota bacterium]